MASLSVNDFKAKITGGGARSNMFRVTINFPPFAQGDTELTSFMAKKASFPASETSKVELSFRGRKIPFDGDRTFADITVGIINDVNHPVREAMIRWKNGINAHSENTGLQNPVDYTADVLIEQLDKSGNVTVTHKLIGAYPLSVGAIEVAFETEGIQEFDVNFAYLYWEQLGVTS